MQKKALTRDQIHDRLLKAEKQINILGVVGVDCNWEELVEPWSNRLKQDPNFEINILCESSNFLFNKALTSDIEYAKSRRPFKELEFIQKRATENLPSLFENHSILVVPKNKKDKEKKNPNVNVEIIHLQIPLHIIQVDDDIFINHWLAELTSSYYQLTNNDQLHDVVMHYIDVFFDEKIGRKYASKPNEEILELFDHKRVPRGIFPRASFYDTDHSQLVIWGLVFDRKGRLLIHRRADNAKDNQGMWDKSVGGHVDFSVDVDTSKAMSRELIEELFTNEIKKEVKGDINAWAVNDEDMINMGEWRTERRGQKPFQEINAYKKEYTFFKLPKSQQVYSPRALEKGQVRRLRVIADVFLYIAGEALVEESLGDLKNSKFKLIELADLKTAMDKGIRGEEVLGFETENLIPKFTPDLTSIMTGELKDILEEFSFYIKKYIKI